MSRKSKGINRVLGLILLILCFQGCLSFNPTKFAQAIEVKIQTGEIYHGIVIDALMNTNTSNSGNWTWAEKQPWCRIGGSGEYIIENMIIDTTAGTTRGSGIFITNSHDVDFRIQNCTITNVNAIVSYSSGIDIEDSSRGVIYNNTIDGTNPIGCGIQLLGYNCYNITIEQNVVTNILQQGILVYGGNDIHILKNNVTNVEFNGIYFYHGTQNSTIAYNFVKDANKNETSGADGGIKLLDVNCDYNEIFNNTVLNCWRGIYLRDSSDNAIYNNSLKNNYDSGIVLSSFSNRNNITDNLICNDKGIANQDRGIFVYDANNNSIRKNTVNNNQQYGIDLDFAKWTEIINNTVNENDQIGIYLHGTSDNNIVQYNSLNGNNLAIGLYLSDYNNVTDNILSDNHYCIFEDETCIGNFIDNNTCPISLYQTPIYIDGLGILANDWEWAKSQSWCSGEGIESDPYIIENLNISGFGFGYSEGIQIRNSDAFVIIRNCLIYGFVEGICFNNVSNARIIGNTISNNENGIYVADHSNFNEISGNICNENRIGIYIYFKNVNYTISNNIVTDNDDFGIYLEDSCHNFSVLDNTVERNYYGIYAYDNCSDLTISGNNVFDNLGEGITLEYQCDDCTISENICINNSIGIWLFDECVRNDIIGNNVKNHDVGIYLDEFIEFVTISENLMDNNSIGLTIWADCYNNSVVENYFVRNEVHALDNGMDNSWNSTSIGNYWDNWTSPDTNSDGIVDFPYIFIEGLAGSNDSLPIAEDGAPRITIYSPENKDRIADVAPSFSVEVFDIYVVEMWYTLDGGLTNYTFTSNETIRQEAWDAVPYGKVTIRFYARDIAGNISFKDVTVRKYSIVLQKRILLWSLIGAVALMGTGSYFMIKIWKIKLEE